MQVIIGDTRDLQDLGKNIIRIYILPRGVMVARLLNHPSHKIHILVMVVSLLRTKLIRCICTAAAGLSLSPYVLIASILKHPIFFVLNFS
jgi:hypothetical protein